MIYKEIYQSWGGEPLCEQNIYFVRKLAAAAKVQYPSAKIYCWTGATLEELKKQFNNIQNFLKDIDILITGRFILEERDVTLPLRGSRNQCILKKNIDF